MPATPRSPRGWTDGRLRRLNMFIVLLAAAGLLALWAMAQPWAGIAAPGDEPSCDRGAPSSVDQEVQSATGDIVTASFYGCTTGYESVNLTEASALGGTSMSYPGQAADEGVTPPAILGLPQGTFYLLAASVLGMLGAVFRAGPLFLLAVVPMRESHAMFGQHKTAVLAGGQFDFVVEMSGTQWHSYAFVATAVLLVCGGVFVFKVNAEQRRCDFEAFKRGERERPPAMTTVMLISSALLRVQMDRVTDLYATTVADVRGTADADTPPLPGPGGDDEPKSGSRSRDMAGARS